MRYSPLRRVCGQCAIFGWRTVFYSRKYYMSKRKKLTFLTTSIAVSLWVLSFTLVKLIGQNEITLNLYIALMVAFSTIGVGMGTHFIANRILIILLKRGRI